MPQYFIMLRRNLTFTLELASAVAFSVGFPEKIPVMWMVAEEKAQYPAKGVDMLHCTSSASLMRSDILLAAVRS